MAAESLKLTAKALAETGIVDEVVKEPVGGAHRDHDQAAEFVGAAIAKHLGEISCVDIENLRDARYKKFRHIGPVSQ